MHTLTLLLICLNGPVGWLDFLQIVLFGLILRIAVLYVTSETIVCIVVLTDYFQINRKWFPVQCKLQA